MGAKVFSRVSGSELSPQHDQLPPGRSDLRRRKARSLKRFMLPIVYRYLCFLQIYSAVARDVVTKTGVRHLDRGLGVSAVSAGNLEKREGQANRYEGFSNSHVLALACSCHGFLGERSPRDKTVSPASTPVHVICTLALDNPEFVGRIWGEDRDDTSQVQDCRSESAVLGVG